jgi:hypothetical protein
VSRGSRALCGLYTITAAWLAFCTINTWGTAATWTSLTMAAASLLPIVAAIRETVIADERRHVAALIAHQERERIRRHGPPLTQREAAAWTRMVARFDLNTPDQEQQ